jgi:hypothetical protein
MSPEPAPQHTIDREPATTAGPCGVRFDVQAAPDAEPAADAKCAARHSAPYSPPESNNTAKSDGAESELSDVAEDAFDADMMDGEPVEDIGEIYPDHWSGAVPVFKPTMHQFKDFKRFVRFRYAVWTCSLIRSMGNALITEPCDWL